MGNMSETNLSPEAREAHRRLRALWDLRRKELGLTQERAAEKMDMTQSAISHFLNGRKPISPWNALRFANLLGVDVSEIRDVGDIKQPNARETRLTPVEWENEDELDQEFVLAPLLDVQLSAGDGSHSGHEVEEYRLPIRRHTLRKQGVTPDRARMVRVLGDSMADLLPDDAVVAINLDEVQPRDGKIFAYTDSDMLKVKYLHPLPGGGLRVRSHNPDYPDEVLSPDEVQDRITIHGRVFMYSSLC